MGDQAGVAPAMSRQEVPQTSTNEPSALDPVPQTSTNEPSALDPVPQTSTNEPSALDPVPQTSTNEPSALDPVPQTTSTNEPSALDPVPQTTSTNEASALDPVPQTSTNEPSSVNSVPQTTSTNEPPALDPAVPQTQTEQARLRDELRLQTLRRKLYRAGIEGDWEAAKKMMDDNGDLDLNSLAVDDDESTVLYIAGRSGRTEFVEKMVKILNDEQVRQRDLTGLTVLHRVVVASGVSAARAIVDRWPWMADEKDPMGYTPLSYAARWRHLSTAKEMVEYLYSKTNDDVYRDSETALNLIVFITESGCYNVALDMLTKHPGLAVATTNRTDISDSVLGALASQPSAFLWEKTFSWFGFKSEKQNDAIELVHVICKELQNKDDSSVRDYCIHGSTDSRKSTLHLATENGVFELVVLCLKYFPFLIRYNNWEGESLLHAAIKHRQIEIFNYITINLFGDNFGSHRTREVAGQGNILHLAALLAPTPQLHSIAGPAFQLQRELQWFKAVEAQVSNRQIDGGNSKGQKPIDLFYEEHKDLIIDAKQWITVTSNSCMVVAALVATVAFASMITVPGGNDTGTGKPVLSRNQVFIVFSISNAFSMISSAIALLMFLSLQTSRFTTDDFLKTVPKNLLRGLLSLFLAVATMMIAFGTTIGMTLQTRLKWTYIPIIIVACIPTIIFTKMQLPLLFQTLGVTSGPSLFPKQKNPSKYSLLLKDV